MTDLALSPLWGGPVGGGLDQKRFLRGNSRQGSSGLHVETQLTFHLYETYHGSCEECFILITDFWKFNALGYNTFSHMKMLIFSGTPHRVTDRA